MEKINHSFKKRFGQNFLSDKTIINKIVSSVQLEEDDLVIEIGPGAGVMTCELVKKCKVLAYEIDKDLEDILQKKVNSDKLNIIWGDFLKRNLLDDLKDYKYKNLYIIANLPYYITTPIITKIIHEKINVSKIVIMVQKEVADRFASKEGTKDYGSITVFLKYYFKIKKLFNVSRNAFFPKPNVDSTVISLEPYVRNETIECDRFLDFVRCCFAHKRKTLKNNLQNYDLSKADEILNKYGLNISSRAEEVPLEAFVEMYLNLCE